MTSLPLRWALTPPFHPYHRSGRARDAGRLFSVTLLYPHGYQVIGLRGALRCPDFPPPDEPAATERTCTAKVGINARKTAVSAEKSAVSPPRRAGMPPDGALPSIRHAACGRLSGVAANRPNRANGAEEASRANGAVGMDVGPERMGRIERMARMARTGGLRRFACAECAKKSNPEGRSDTSSRPFGGEGRPGYRLFFSRKMFRWASSGLRRSSSTNSKSRMTSASASR